MTAWALVKSYYQKFSIRFLLLAEGQGMPG